MARRQIAIFIAEEGGGEGKKELGKGSRNSFKKTKNEV